LILSDNSPAVLFDIEQNSRQALPSSPVPCTRDCSAGRLPAAAFQFTRAAICGRGSRISGCERLKRCERCRGSNNLFKPARMSTWTGCEGHRLSAQRASSSGSESRTRRQIPQERSAELVSQKNRCKPWRK
jgi:hypothetical protein